MKNIAYLLVGLVSMIACGDDDGPGAGATGGAGASGAGASGAGGTGATGAGGAGASGGGGQGAGGGTGGTGGGMLCGGEACEFGYICCDDTCVDPSSNLAHCGGCDVACEGATPYCDGSCKATPCEGPDCNDAQTCCGAECCDIGTSICCYQVGGAFAGPSCTAPTDDGNCPGGCHNCP